MRRPPAGRDPAERPPFWRPEAVPALLQAVLVTTTGVLPAFLVGALTVQIRDDLSLGPAQMGIAAATLFTVSGLLARRLGRFVQTVGAGTGIAISAALATVALGVLAVAGSYLVLLAGLAVGGLANALAQPAANLRISRAVTSARLGLAFGIKQSSIPAATMLSGLAVPVIAVSIGWRWAFAMGACLAAAIATWSLLSAGLRPANDAPEEAKAPPDHGTPPRALLVVTIAGALAAAAATSLGVFLIDSAVQIGMSPSTAGLVFAVAAGSGLVLRIVWGAVIDRHPGRSPYIFMANLLTGGAVGFLLLTVGTEVTVALGAWLAFASGWTWTGLLHFAVVRDNRARAALATGTLQTGVSLGSAAGPLLFGLVVEVTSYRTGWFVAAGTALAAATLFRVGRHMIRSSRGLPTGRGSIIRDKERT